MRVGKAKTVIFSSIALLWLILILFQGCGQNNREDDQHTAQSKEASHGKAVPTDEDFLGDKTCQGCHPGAYDEWTGSHHDLAMQEATDENVLGNFNEVTFTSKGITSRFFKKEGKFFVNTEGPEGKYEDFEVIYTFGVEPLQQYIVAFPNGRFQCLHTAWDTEKKKWFDLYPDEEIHHEERLHWTNGGMNWNHMCADCHSTNLRKNFDEQTDSYNTTYSIIDVSCEACHGPGKKHVEWAENLRGDEYKQEEVKQYLHLTTEQNNEQQVDECARCHALRTQVSEFYDFNGQFMDHYYPSVLQDGQYHADGQILGEVYVYGSFLQSKMYKHGVKCTDCHNPHSLELKLTGNALCSQCHAPQQYDTEAHHFHPMQTDGAECVNCHMTGRYYMVNDYRRDHSFRIPRPDLSVKHGTPNACNDCHEDRSGEWAAKWIEEWYGPDRPRHFSEVLVKGRERDPSAVPQLAALASDTSQAIMARATAVWYMGQMLDQQSVNAIRQHLNDQDPLMRHTAANSLEVLPNEQKAQIYPDLLEDEMRSVRIEAVDALIGVPGNALSEEDKQNFSQGLIAYQKALAVRADFPGGQLEKGVYYEKIGQPNRAEQAYLRAIKIDNYFNMARMNLANLYYRQGKLEEAEQVFLKIIEQEPGYGETYYSLGLLYAEQKEMEKARTFLKQAADKINDNERVLYNYALVLQNIGDIEAAKKVFARAIEKYPQSTSNIYALAFLKYQQKDMDEAKKLAQKLLNIAPNNQQYQQFARMLQQQ